MYTVSKSKLKEDKNGNIIIPDEVCRAIFYDMDHNFNKEDVTMYLENYLEDAKTGRDYGFDENYVKAVLNDPQMLEDLTLDYEDEKDQGDNNWSVMVRNAMEYNQEKNWNSGEVNP